jgi:hypothetical protein
VNRQPIFVILLCYTIVLWCTCRDRKLTDDEMDAWPSIGCVDGYGMVWAEDTRTQRYSAGMADQLEVLAVNYRESYG